jgi:integrase
MGKALGGDLADWRIHDLRRTVSTGLARLGVDPFVRRRVLNHALQGVDAIYDQFDYLEPKRAALDLWATELDRIVNGEPEAANVVRLNG